MSKQFKRLADLLKEPLAKVQTLLPRSKTVLPMVQCSKKSAVNSASQVIDPPGALDATIPTGTGEDMNGVLDDKAHEEGIKGLATALVREWGSLESAFTSFDFNCRGKITRTQWTTGLLLMRFDCEALTGVSANQLFKMMDLSGGGKAGHITHEDWNTFFGNHGLSTEMLIPPGEDESWSKKGGGRAVLLRWREKAAKKRHTTDGSTSLTRPEPTGGASTRDNEKKVTEANKAKVVIPVVVPEDSASSEHGTDEEELKAEEEQLAEEIESLNLTSAKALAYLLVAKLGSLDKAFKWFDTVNKGSIPRVSWDSGEHLLHLDMEKLTGLKAQDIFGMIANDPREGLVTRSEWKQFFKTVMTKKFKNVLLRAAGGPGEEGSLTLKERARVRIASQQSAMLRRSTRSNSLYMQKPEGDGLDPDNDESDARCTDDVKVDDAETENVEAEIDEAKPPEDTSAKIESKIPDAIHAGSSAAEKDNVSDMKPAPPARVPRVPRVTRADDVARRNIVRRVRPPQVSQEEDDGYEGCDALLGIINRDAKDDSDSESCQEDLFDAEAFEAHIRQQLDDLSKGACLELPTTLSDVEQQIVQKVAAEMQICTCWEAAGGDRQMVAFKLGDFSARVRQQLEKVPPGKRSILSLRYTAEQRRLTCALAAELDLWVRQQNEHGERVMEVFNLADFAHKAQTELSSFYIAQQRKYLKSQFSREEQIVLKTIAHQLGHAYEVRNEGGVEFLVVLETKKFARKVRYECEQLEPGSSKVYDGELASLHHDMVKEIAYDMKLLFELEGESQHPCVTRPYVDEDGNNITPSRRRGKGCGFGCDDDSESSSDFDDDDEDDTEDEDSMLERLFEAYATGNLGKQRVFLRWPDLQNFAEDMKGIMPSEHRLFCRFCPTMECCFDDTLQLQQDLGTRTHKGLTLKWFQVFIQKAVSMTDLSMMNFLCAMVKGEK